jgi:hypothetical protein
MKRSFRRGGAAVELAVLSLVIVPLIMYTFFLAEMFYMKLNGQEAALQAPWDFALVEFSNPKKKVEHDGYVARQSRRTYCDHSAAYNSYQIGYDCQDTIHHSSMAAHECWMTDEGKQVQCNRVDQPLTGDDGAIRAISDTFPSSGVVSCTARLGIMNYYLPNKFLENFTKGEMTTKRKMKSRWAGTNGQNNGVENVHEDGKSNTGAATGAQPGGTGSASKNYFLLGQTEIRMLTDTWAVTHMYNGKGIDSIDQNKIAGHKNALEWPTEHPVYDRLTQVYWKVNDNALSKSSEWHGMMQKFLHYDSQEDQASSKKKGDRGTGDHMSTPSMRFEKNTNPQKGAEGKYAAGWGDSRNQGDRAKDYWGAMDPTGKQ